MQLRFIDKGTILYIREETYNNVFDGEYEAVFYALDSENTFLVESKELFQSYESLRENAYLRMSFLRGDNMYTCTGKARNVLRDGKAYLTRISLLSGITEACRREHHRDEMTLLAQVYALPGDKIGDPNFIKNMNVDSPLLSAHTYDISSGGLCLISNSVFESEYEPYFAIDFTIGSKRFLLPSKLTRKGDCPQTLLYKYSYGFMFLYNAMPEERTRLITAILSSKMAAYRQ